MGEKNLAASGCGAELPGYRCFFGDLRPNLLQPADLVGWQKKRLPEVSGHDLRRFSVAGHAVLCERPDQVEGNGAASLREACSVGQTPDQSEPDEEG